MASFSVVKIVFVLTALLVCISPGCKAEFCNAVDFGSDAGSIPRLPDQFALRVEVTLINLNSTIIVTERYDSVNNRGSLTIGANSTKTHVIFDYEDDEIFFITGGSGMDNCYVQTLSQPVSASQIFGITRVNGSLHIAATGRFFNMLSNDTPTNYLGLVTIRGIPTLHWQACFNDGNLSFTADYYYTTTDWAYAVIFNPGQYDMIPILINVEGLSLRDGKATPFSNVYSIFDYHTGPNSVHDKFFSVPTGLACTGRIPGIPLPSVPDVFSMAMQHVSIANSVTTVREFYHKQHKLFRQDSYNTSSVGTGPYTVIHDFDTQVEYAINRHTSSCSITSLGDGNLIDYDQITDEQGGSIRLISPLKFFFLGDRFNYTYEGVTMARGVKVDAWVSVRDFERFGRSSNLTNGIIDLFFTRPEYSLSSLHSAREAVVPWSIRLRGIITYFNNTKPLSQNILLELEIFDFSTSEPSYDVYDVSLCFHDDNVYTLIIMFDVPLEGIDLTMLRTNIRSSIIAYTNLKPLQVNNIQLLHSNSSSIVMSLHLANLSEHAQIDRNMVVTADWAFMYIVNTTKPDSTLPFQVIVSDGILVSPLLLRFGRGRDITMKTCNSTGINNSNSTCNNSNLTNRWKLTDEVLIGIALAVFFGGLIFGMCTLFLTRALYKCVAGSSKGSTHESRNESLSVKYRKHSDEVDLVR